MLCISSMSQYLDEKMFSRSLLFSAVELLNCLFKSSKFGKGLNNNFTISTDTASHEIFVT